MNKPTMLEAALEYASRGWAVFPCAPGGKIPFGGTNGSTDATTDEQQIRDWWEANPTANVAIATGGKSGLHVIDIDTARSDFMPRLQTTLIARTRNGGWHYFYRYPVDVTGLPNTSKKAKEPLHPDVDTRGEGGYVLVFPSVVDGDKGNPDATGVYQWVNDIDPVEMPSWIVERIKPKPVALVPRATYSMKPATSWAEKALREECDAVAAMGEGGRNHRLNQAAFSLGQIVAGGHLSTSLVHGELMHAASVCGLPQREALTTIKSGLRGGMKHPRSPKTELIKWEDPFGGADIVVELDDEPEVLAPIPPPRAPLSATSDESRWELLQSVRSLGGLCDTFPAWVIRGADHPQPALTIAALLALGSVFAGRRLVYRRALSSLYVVSLAGSAEGKNRPQSCLGRCIDDVWPALAGPNSFSSGPAFIEAVRVSVDGGVGTCLVLDEYGMQLSAMIGPRAATHRQDLKQSLTELSTKGTDKWSPALSLARGGKKLELIAPCVTLLGSTTPESLHSVLTSTDIADGFVGRHLWFRSQLELPMWQPPETRGDDSIPANVRGALAAIQERHQTWHMGLSTSQSPDGLDALRAYVPQVVGETEEAARLLLEHKLKCDEERRKGQRLEIPRATLGRMPEFAARVALVLATLAQPENEVPTVTELEVRVAIAIVEESGATFAESLAGNRRAAWDDPAAQLELVLSAIRGNGGAATRNEILRRCRRLTSKQIEEALSRLEEEGVLGHAKDVPTQKGGRPATTYQLRD